MRSGILLSDKKILPQFNEKISPAAPCHTEIFCLTKSVQNNFIYEIEKNTNRHYLDAVIVL